MKSVKFYTLGCKVNQYDTQSIRERFLRQGLKEIYNGRKADIYLINTCTVTGAADRKSRDTIRQCIKSNPQARIIVTGCLVDKDTLSLSQIKGIDFLISKRFFADGISSFYGHTRAFLKIQDGCDNFCSYCKVPLVRGRSRSRPIKEIVEEAKRLVNNGYKEIVLSGICLGSFGKDLKPKKTLVDIIEVLEKIEGLLRIRLSSIEGGDVSEGLIHKMANSKKLCRHLHIPIQSGDDRILKKMKRRYSHASYLKLIRKIRKVIPDIAITTDVMVGFPGETEKNFQNTVKLIKEIMPLRVHIFAYSPREGTVAGYFKNQISHNLVQRRVLSLKDIARRCSLVYQKKFLGKKLDVLIETRSKEDSAYWQGYSDNYIKVRFKSKKDLKNKLIALKLKPL